MNLVSGATGIVGAHIVHDLLRRDEHVRAIVRGEEKFLHLRRVLDHYDLEADRTRLLEVVDVDVLDVSGVRDIMSGVSAVFHAAAMVSFTPHEKDLMWRVNVEGTSNMLNAALEAGVERFCHVSSVASIGRDPEGIPSTEESVFEDAPHVSPYSYTKYHAELEVFRAIAEGLDAFMVNPSIIIGPGRENESSMAMVDKVRQGINYYPSGTAAIVDARDVSQALLLGREKARTGHRFLLVGEHIAYKQLFELISSTAGVAPPQKVIPKWVLDIAAGFESVRSFLFKSKPMVTKYTAHSACSHYHYDNSKAVNELGLSFRGAEEAINNAMAFRTT